MKKAHVFMFAMFGMFFPEILKITLIFTMHAYDWAIPSNMAHDNRSIGQSVYVALGGRIK